MEHYFTNNPDLKSDPKILNVTFNSHNFKFKTDNGVFCKDYLDEGSNALLKVVSKKEIHGRNLDVGCGYGPIGGILAFFNPHSDFILLDVNARACALARDNMKLNGIQNVTVFESNIYEKVMEDQFDNIFINPPIRAGKKVIYQMFAGAYDILKPNGSLYIVIRKSHGAESAQKYIATIFGNCELLKRDKGYYIYQAIKEEPKTL
jgi:16S rRNA (guanine1207-N2)-methyltransferase